MENNYLDYPTVQKLIEVLWVLPQEMRIDTHGFNSLDVRLMSSVYGSQYVSLVGYSALGKTRTIDKYNRKNNLMVSKADETRHESARRAGRNPAEDTISIGVMLSSSEWTTAEKCVIKWQFRLLGHFRRALFQAIAMADDDNLELLSRGFPDEVAGYKAWTRGDLATRLRDAGLDI